MSESKTRLEIERELMILFIGRLAGKFDVAIGLELEDTILELSDIFHLDGPFNA